MSPFVFIDLNKFRPKWAVTIKGDAEGPAAEGSALARVVAALRHQLSFFTGGRSSASTESTVALSASVKVPLRGVQCRRRARAHALFSQATKKFVSVAAWTAAFHRYAIAAAAAGQLSLTSAMAHLDNCLMIAEEARARRVTSASHLVRARIDCVLVHRKAPQTIAAQYDEAIRRQWSDFAANNVPGFDVNKAALAIDREVLRRLESVSMLAFVRPVSSNRILCTRSGGVCGFYECWQGKPPAAQ